MAGLEREGGGAESWGLKNGDEACGTERGAGRAGGGEGFGDERALGPWR